MSILLLLCDHCHEVVLTGAHHVPLREPEGIRRRSLVSGKLGLLCSFTNVGNLTPHQKDIPQGGLDTCVFKVDLCSHLKDGFPHYIEWSELRSLYEQKLTRWTNRGKSKCEKTCKCFEMHTRRYILMRRLDANAVSPGRLRLSAPNTQTPPAVGRYGAVTATESWDWSRAAMLEKSQECLSPFHF